LLLGIIFGVVLLAVRRLRGKNRDTDRLSSLQEEDEYLREEIERLKSGKV
jgi:hypothetical protein